MNNKKPRYKIDFNILNFFNEALSDMTLFKEWAKTPEVVPTDRTHKELLQNNPVNIDIYKYYHQRGLFKDFTEKESYVNDTLPISENTIKITPYNLKICNAYYYRPDFIFKLGNIVYNPPVYSDSKKIEYLEDLKPYFLEYAKGFKDGYNNFEKNKIKLGLEGFADPNANLKKVFDFITTRPTMNKHCWGDFNFSKQGFNTKGLKAYENGLLQGYYYKAWTIVFTQNDFFTPLFKGLEKPQQSDKPKRSYEVKHHVLAYILDCFANNNVLPTGEKTKLESIGFKRIEKAGDNFSGNTFYKMFNKIIDNTLNKEADFKKIAGNEWRSIVLELSENREALKSYLKGKGL